LNKFIAKLRGGKSGVPFSPKRVNTLKINPEEDQVRIPPSPLVSHICDCLLFIKVWGAFIKFLPHFVVVALPFFLHRKSQLMDKGIAEQTHHLALAISIGVVGNKMGVLRL
jgi:hypothetical protein